MLALGNNSINYSPILLLHLSNELLYGVATHLCALNDFSSSILPPPPLLEKKIGRKKSELAKLAPKNVPSNESYPQLAVAPSCTCVENSHKYLKYSTSL